MDKAFQDKKTMSYQNSVHSLGRITLFTGLFCTFLFPLTLWLIFGILPTKEGLITGFISISSLMAPVAIAQIFSYAPLLGSSALYMSYLSGNLANLKIPSTAVALEATEVDGTTDEGEVISGIAASASVYISEIMILLAVILLKPLAPVLSSPSIQPAFQQITPALFGSLILVQILKDWKLGIVPFIISFIVMKFSLVPSGIMLPTILLSTMFITWILYNKKILK